MDQPRKVNLHINDSTLLCKAGCGFYGNPAWQDYCSVCFKKYKNQAKLAQLTASPKHGAGSLEDNFRQPESPLGFASVSGTPSPPFTKSFEKFEEKKRQQVNQRSKTLKSIFKRASTFSDKATSATGLASATLPVSWKENSKKASFDNLSLQPTEEYENASGSELKFNSDLALQDIRRQTKKMVEKLNKMNVIGYFPRPRDCATIEEMSESVHDFYQYMTDRFERHATYQGSSDEQLEQLIDITESVLMESMYHSLSSRIQTEDEDQDLALQKRIKSLNWIMTQHLDIEIDMRNPIVRDLIDKAITEVIEMGSRQVPAEKLSTVVNCAKSICKLLQVANEKPISADQFLPGLVFVVIKANPPLLHSNIKFITRFSNPRRLMSGEAGYYFTNLCCAVAFIEKLNGDSLNIPEAEFSKYISGESLPPGAFEQSAYLCEAFRIMYSNVALLKDLTQRQKKFETEADELRQKMTAFKEDMSRKIEPALQGRSKPVPHYSVDDDVDIQFVPSFMRERILEERMERASNVVLVDIQVDSSTERKSDGESEPELTDLVERPLPEPLIPEVLAPSPQPS
ncbi:Rab5 GDP/GTP exchange factor [Halotydeus destructor]|nr:Rab5 GDP/GTP exchange factor [Halotydeus destructor]